MKPYIDGILKAIRETDFSPINTAAGMCILCLQKGGTIYIAGNGGSCADAQHIATELVGRFRMERKGLAAVALTNPASITAIGNDYGFDSIFCRQIEAVGESGDVLIALSTSGKSVNILNAIKKAKKQHMFTIAFGDMDADTVFVPATSVASHAQEVMLIAGHLLCSAVEKARKEVR